MNRTVVSILVLVAILFVGLFFWYKQPELVKKAEERVPNEVVEVSATGKNKYKDGVYQMDVTYISPGGKDELGINLSIENDMIIAGSIVNKGGDPESKSFQNRFILRFPKDVVGQSFDTLKLEPKSGASLTTAAFNQALIKLRAQAINS